MSSAWLAWVATESRRMATDLWEGDWSSKAEPLEGGNLGTDSAQAGGKPKLQPCSELV
jgi:hypothetical protein